MYTLSCLEQYDASSALAPSHRSVNHFDTIFLRTDGRPSSVAKEMSNNEEMAVVYHAADSRYTKKVQRTRKELQVCRLVRVHRSTWLGKLVSRSGAVVMKPGRCRLCTTLSILSTKMLLRVLFAGLEQCQWILTNRSQDIKGNKTLAAEAERCR